MPSQNLTLFQTDLCLEKGMIVIMEVESKKSWIVSLILCFFLGIFGIHNFYAKKIKIGIIQLVTLGGLGVWALIDLFYIIQQKYKDKNGKIIRKKESENKILKLVIVFMIISIIGGIIYFLKQVNVGNIALNSDLVKKYNEVSKLEPEIQVYLYNDATQKQIDEIEEKIRAIDGVSTTKFVSKEEALTQMKGNLGERAYLLDGYEEVNIFPASFIVKIKDQSKYEKVYEKIMKFSNIKKVTKNNENIKQASMINDEINVMLIFWIILIIMCAITILGKIVAILFILKKFLPNPKKLC